jgi:hypothetical protein
LTCIVIPTPEQYEAIKLFLKSSHEDEQRFHQESIERLQAQIKRVDSLLGRIYDDCLEGVIDQALFQTKRRELTERRQQFIDTLGRHHQADKAYQDKGLMILEIAKSAAGFYKSQKDPVKREILKMVLSNFILEGREPKPELHIAFSSFREIKAKRNKVEVAGWLSNLIEHPLYVSKEMMEHLCRAY